MLFHGTMSYLEKLRKTQLDKINNLVIPATNFYPEKVKAFRTNLDKIGEIKKSKENHKKEISRAQTKKEFEKVSKLSSEVKKNEDDEKLEGNKVESGLADFEAERLTDNKYLLLHYIHSELAFHATSLEKLTKLYGEIMCHEPKEKLPEFINNYNLNSLKDTNIANKYGFTVGETARKLEKMKNTNNAASSGVNKGIVNVGVNPNPNPKSLSSNPKSAVSRLEDDPIIIENKASLSPNLKPGNLNSVNQGFNTGGNYNMNMKSSALNLASSQPK
jgi:hypothetical protein